MKVEKSITIEAPVERVFEAFTADLNSWWPRSHHMGSSDEFRSIIECREGGRWYEEGTDGSVCQMGRVLHWDPPHRVVMSWEVNEKWEPDPRILSEVDVRFTSLGSETRVDLEHRNLETYGPLAEKMVEVFEGPDAWAGLLKLLADYVVASG